jgi:hypothetical protein
VVYSTTYGRGYSEELSYLGPPAGGGATSSLAAGLLDEVLVAGRKHGYIFNYVPIDSNGDGIYESFSLNADPQSPGVTATRYFFINASGVVRQSRTGPADASSTPLD